MSPLSRAVARIRRWSARNRRLYVSSAALRRRLNRRIATGSLGAGHGASPTIVRSPILLGKSSEFLNRIDLEGANEPATKFIEKGVAGNAGELAFWLGRTWRDPVLRGERYSAVRPLDIYVGESVSVMYFPYVPALDEDLKTLRREYRSNLDEIASAVADFNGSNLMQPDSGLPRILRFDAVRPARSDLQLRLGIAGDDLAELVRMWDEAHAAWQASQATVSGLRWCLCHNDVSPHNSASTGGVTMLADFGLACGGPVGSDLHTLIRWSGRTMHDPVHVDGLLKTYTDRVTSYDESISLEHVRLAAWATFFLRYTNLKFSSARYIGVFRLATRRMIEVGRTDP